MKAELITTFIIYALLFIPAIVIVAISTLLITSQGIHFPLRLFGAGVVCLAMLPIQMWETVPIVVAACVAAEATRQCLKLIEQSGNETSASSSFCGDAATTRGASLRFTLSQALFMTMSFALVFATSRAAIPRCDYLPYDVYLYVGVIVGCGVEGFAWLLQNGHSRLALVLYVPGSLFGTGWAAGFEPGSSALVMIPWTVTGLTQFSMVVGYVVVAVVSAHQRHAMWVQNPWTKTACIAAMLLMLMLTIRLYAFLYRPQLSMPGVVQIEGNRYSELIEVVRNIDRNSTPSSDQLDLLTRIAKCDSPIVIEDDKPQRHDNRRDVSIAFVLDAERLMTQGEVTASLGRLTAGILLNQRMAIGGTTIDLLVRNACNGQFFDALWQWRHCWSEADLEFVQVRLQEAVGFVERIEVVEERTAAHDALVSSWFDRLIGYDLVNGRIDGVICKRVRVGSLDKSIRDCVMEDAASLDLLITDCAIRRYVVQQGKPPGSLCDLLPGFLVRVPIDPFTGDPFVYRKMGDRYLLYSVGSNRQDDHEEVARYGGDLVLSTH